MKFSYEHNFEVSLDELLKISSAPYVSSKQIPINHVMVFMGFPLVPKESGVFVVFVRCSYCGQDDHKIENNCCGHCGAWIS